MTSGTRSDQALDTASGMASGTCVMVFARAPLPGQCKTRLIPALGARGAANLHAKLVRRALSAACSAGAAAVELWCTPDTRHSFFEECVGEFSVTLRTQNGPGLGERMRFALDSALSRHQGAIIIGSDIPGLDAEYLRAAMEALRQAPAVFGPAEDGGYVLVGLRQKAPRLFEAIDWGGPQVMAQTRIRLAELAWHAAELAPLWDLDRPEDLVRLAELRNWG